MDVDDAAVVLIIMCFYLLAEVKVASFVGNFQRTSFVFMWISAGCFVVQAEDMDNIREDCFLPKKCIPNIQTHTINNNDENYRRAPVRLV